MGLDIAQKVEFNASGLIYSGPVVLVGWSIKETTGSAQAELDLYDGISAAAVTGIPAFPITLLPNESTRDVLINARMLNGIWANITGALEGSILIIVED